MTPGRRRQSHGPDRPSPPRRPAAGAARGLGSGYAGFSESAARDEPRPAPQREARPSSDGSRYLRRAVAGCCFSAASEVTAALEQCWAGAPGHPAAVPGRPSKHREASGVQSAAQCHHNG